MATFILSLNTQAADPTYIEEVQSMGYLSGLGLACQASKYDTFEMLARAFLISKATSNEQQEEGMKAFNEAKVESFVSKIKDNMSRCSQIAASFDKQRIFKTVLYGDGTMKMPDGTIIKPRQAYDSTLVYQKDPDARANMIKMYQEMHNQIISNPEYQKALRAKQAEVGF